MSHPLRRIAPIVILSLLAAPPAAGAASPQAKARARVAAPPPPSTAIIALPLNPVVPAAQRSCTARTPSGLGYTILRPAVGAKPAEGDVALVNYIGYLAATGAVFDQGMGSPLPVGGVIPGFAEGLRMSAKTGITRLCIPAALGYGDKGTGPIPANADLVFQIELIDFKSAAEVESMRKAQAADPAAK